jgi:hypothetical protein
MGKPKRKLTAAEKAEKKKRKKEYMTIFINGKQKRVKRPPTIDGMDVDEFIRRNADPIWLHQNEMWEYMEQRTDELGSDLRCLEEDAASEECEHSHWDGEDDIPSGSPRARLTNGCTRRRRPGRNGVDRREDRGRRG